ncbi:hypothetical protein HN018_04350 [Lichenicola cladoniae]|uniref:Uncharacterized protein n=1 Tax=Lichenicola cladoniae TaxID=1484109 RepID=A0A6M8HM00_9PROT|nr:hypothetical protein [Lichenicola cladoniae]NPD69948.1 hypothetical protein [Acetobacteraceae bacterium]QKE89368.1 hypothetical protein HN018_04350 [Lichenicola cladoniae]
MESVRTQHFGRIGVMHVIELVHQKLLRPIQSKYLEMTAHQDSNELWKVMDQPHYITRSYTGILALPNVVYHVALDGGIWRRIQPMSE